MTTGKKFTDLIAGELSSTDIFAIVDTAGEQLNSRNTTASDISAFIYSIPELQANLSNIKIALNGADDTISSGLNASKLFYIDESGQALNRNASYFLEYSNLLNAPDRIENVNQLTNGMSYAGLVQNADSFSLEVNNPLDTAGAIVKKITTDMIEEGQNKYFNDSNVENTVNDLFGGLFNQYSSTFDSGNNKDSLMGVPAEWTGAVGTAGSQTCNQLIVRQSGVTTEDFNKGQVIRVYGATVGTRVAMGSAISPSTTVSGFNPNGGNNQGNRELDFYYRVAKFDLKTGRIGARSNIVTQQISLAGNTFESDFLRAFDQDHFITVDLTGVTESTDGVLIYRAVGTNSVLKLVAVLGPKDLSDANNTFRDYYNFDHVPWSGRSESDNSYPSDVIHFPHQILNSPSAAAGGHEEELDGWADMEIDSVSPSGLGDGSFKMVFTESALINNINGLKTHLVSIAHNDTSKINGGIQSKIDPLIGLKSLSLNAKTYNVSCIDMPTDFGLIGIIGLTKLKKLPWASYTLAGASGAPRTPILKTPGVNDAKNVSIENVDFDGNAINQFLLADTDGNRFIDFGTQTSDITVSNCKIQNMIGDGVRCSLPLRFKMLSSEISNGGVTDRYEITPLVVDSGINTMVTNNVIQNFTVGIDATVTQEGVIANNVIKNVGAGIDVYGSTFLVSSPNVLMGPANEFLSSPDVLNSEFDSINIRRSQLQNLGIGADFRSDDLVYQESGSTFDLTADSMAQQPQVVFRTKLLSVDTENNYSVYGNEIGPGAVDIGNSTMTATAPGGVPDTDSYIRTNQPYAITKVGDTDWTALGAAVNKVGCVFVWNGATMPSYSSTGGKITSNEFPGYENSGHQGRIVLSRRTQNQQGTGDLDASDGQFGFNISNSDATSTLYNLVETNGVYSYPVLKNLYTSRLSSEVKEVISVSTVTDTDFTVNCTAANIKLGDQVEITGADSASRIDSGYTTGKRYVVSSIDAGSAPSVTSFTLVDTDGTTPVTTTSGTPTGLTFKVIIDTSHAENTTHYGIAWSASRRANVKAGDITSGGTWSYGRLDGNGLDDDGVNVYGTTQIDTMNANRYYADYQVSVTNLNYVDKYRTQVRIYNKDGWSAPTGLYDATGVSGTQYNGFVVAKNPTNEEQTNHSLTIRYYGNTSTVLDANSGATAPQGNPEPFGTINIVDDFVMAQGLIK